MVMTDAIEMDTGELFSSVVIENKKDKFVWEVINVYGLVQHDRKIHFLTELSDKLERGSVPRLIGGDFNMIRYEHEKNTASGRTVWMEIFNSFINDHALRDVSRGGSKFTWTNKQKKTYYEGLRQNSYDTRVGGEISIGEGQKYN